MSSSTPPRGSEPPTGVLSAIADAAIYPRPVWRSERAYVLASIAGIVGLGSLWRFPYMAGLHGGASFVLAYLACVLLIAVPLAVLEGAAGGLTRRSPVGLFRRAGGRPGALLGWAVIGLTVAIMSYYFVITGWTLGYAFDAILDRLTTFPEFTSGMASMWLFLTVAVLVLVLLVREVSAIERASLVFLPVLLLIVGGMAIYGQTLDGAAEARSFYLGMDWGALVDSATWRAAAGQAFYSLGVGQGVLIAYGSYVPAGTNLVRSTTLIAGTNSLVSVLSGLMVFPIVFTFGIAPDSGSELSFTAFPRAFAELQGGEYLAVAFFLLLFLAGFTSCLGGSIVVMSSIRDELRLSRTQAARLTVALIVVLGIPSALSFTQVGLEVAGLPFLDLMDRATGSGILIALGMVGAAVLAFRLPSRRLVAAIDASTVGIGRLKFRPALLVPWARVIPALAALVFVATLLFE